MQKRLDELNNVVVKFGSTVTISEDEYAELVSDSRQLYHLQANGVGNWDGFDFAMKEYAEEENF